MDEELCTCDDPDCLEAHDCEDAPATFEIWFRGERSETLAFADSEDEVRAEIANLTSDAPEDFPFWMVKDRASGQKWTAPKFFDLCA